MPMFETPKSLINLSINSLYNIVFNILSKKVDLAERTDEAVRRAEDPMEKTFATAESKKRALDLKQMLERHSRTPVTFTKYFAKLPSEFLNELFTRVLKDLFKVAGYKERDIDSDEITNEKVREHDVHKFMRWKWSFPPRIRVAFNLLLSCLLSEKTHTINMSQLTNKYFNIFSAFISQTAMHWDDGFMSHVKENNRCIFINELLHAQNKFSSLTNISMQNLADGELLWCICCHCPNLLHLDLSGERFDLQRHALDNEAEGSVTAVAKETSGKKQRLYEDADFIDSLCGLYGNFEEPHPTHEGTAQGCFNLRRLLLPSYCWEESEEKTLIDEMMTIFHQLPYLEEVTGVCLFRILCKLNESEYDCPLMLKLKKFDGKTGGHHLVGINPERLKKVKLPLVEEVVFNSNVFMPPSTLGQLFPNMTHLTITPYDSRSYNFYSILPYLTNLVSLDIEFHQGLSLSIVCDLAKQCCLLKALSVTCPSLNKETCVDNNTQTSVNESKRKSSPLSYRVDKQEKRMYESVEYEDNKYNVFYYRRKMQNVWMTGAFPRDDNSMPVFSKLQKLQFFDLKQVDNFALFQCVRGSPLLQIFTVVVDKSEPDFKEEFDDCFIGKLAPYLRRAREVTIAINKDENGYQYLDLSGAAVAHLIYFCPDIRSISRVDDWNMSEVETEGLNYYFEKNNYIVRVH